MSATRTEAHVSGVMVEDAPDYAKTKLDDEALSLFELDIEDAGSEVAGAELEEEENGQPDLDPHALTTVIEDGQLFIKTDEDGVVTPSELLGGDEWEQALVALLAGETYIMPVPEHNEEGRLAFLQIELILDGPNAGQLIHRLELIDTTDNNATAKKFVVQDGEYYFLRLNARGEEERHSYLENIEDEDQRAAFMTMVEQNETEYLERDPSSDTDEEEGYFRHIFDETTGEERIESILLPKEPAQLDEQDDGPDLLVTPIEQISPVSQVEEDLTLLDLIGEETDASDEPRATSLTEVLDVAATTFELVEATPVVLPDWDQVVLASRPEVPLLNQATIFETPTPKGNPAPVELPAFQTVDLAPSPPAIKPSQTTQEAPSTTSRPLPQATFVSPPTENQFFPPTEVTPPSDARAPIEVTQVPSVSLVQESESLPEPLAKTSLSIQEAKPDNDRPDNDKAALKVRAPAIMAMDLRPGEVVSLRPVHADTHGPSIPRPSEVPVAPPSDAGDPTPAVDTEPSVAPVSDNQVIEKSAPVVEEHTTTTDERASTKTTTLTQTSNTHPQATTQTVQAASQAKPAALQVPAQQTAPVAKIIFAKVSKETTISSPQLGHTTTIVNEVTLPKMRESAAHEDEHEQKADTASTEIPAQTIAPPASSAEVASTVQTDSATIHDQWVAEFGARPQTITIPTKTSWTHTSQTPTAQNVTPAAIESMMQSRSAGILDDATTTSDGIVIDFETRAQARRSVSRARHTTAQSRAA